MTSATPAERLSSTMTAEIPTVFSWAYDKDERLTSLYETSKGAQWNATTDLDWSTEVDVEREAMQTVQIFSGSTPAGPPLDLSGTALAGWNARNWLDYGVAVQRWNLSQFLHGEQGALICACRIVETAPTYAAKEFAATQAADEARHVEAFNRYVVEKLGERYPIDPRLETLLNQVVTDQRWDVTYLGMQIMVEGLALASFSMMHAMTSEPLLRRMLRYVLRDEARHVSFGLLTLGDRYRSLTAHERRDRQEFALEAALLLRARMQRDGLWTSLGVDATDVAVLRERTRHVSNTYEQGMLSRLARNCRKIGLLVSDDDWLGSQFIKNGIPIR
jgi:hypothetical protein